MANMEKLVLQSSLGQELTAEEANVLSGLVQSSELADGDFLLAEESTDDSLHVLLEGRLDVVRRSAGDDLVSLAVLKAGDLAGELSFIDGEPHTVSLRSIGESHVISIKREDFESIIDEYPRIVYKVMRAIARSTHRIVHRMNLEFIELNNYIYKQHGRY